LEQYVNLYNNAKNIVSLNVKVGDECTSELLEILEDEKYSTSEFIDNQHLCDSLDTLLNTLSESDRKLIEKRFGLNGNIVHTLNQLAEELEIPRERVRRIISNSLGQLRRHSVRSSPSARRSSVN
jgi:RNA polymerase sigma factor (sigma-70 family)